MNDKQLRQNVLAELEYEPSVNATHIGVTVDKGVVTLTGHVPSFAEKHGAEKAVQRVKGVRAIANEMQVRFASDAKTADHEIAQRALDILRWSTGIPSNTLSVTVDAGWVTLTGDVEWQYQKIAAEAAVRKLSGVVSVINEISLKPASVAAGVREKIEDALRRSAEVEARLIRITVDNDDTVTLDGNVHDWKERDAVKYAAWSAPGVRKVEDHLTVLE